jgi:hypothetical protein
MITPNEAFEIAISVKPNAAFSGDCVDYRGCWVFPYSEKNDNLANRVFVNKKSGEVLMNDPIFDVEHWNQCQNHKDELSPELLRKGRALKHSAVRVKFADDAYLMHHGVKGMKWGVRNAETLARYAAEGGGGGVDTKKETFKTEKDLDDALRKLGVDPEKVDQRQHPGNSFANKLEAYYNAVDEYNKKNKDKKTNAQTNAQSKSQNENEPELHDWQKTVKELDEEEKAKTNKAIRHGQMGYKLTFEDGSDAYLSHHGVKGMKWGVRNAETLAKYGIGGQGGSGSAGGSGGVDINDLDDDDYLDNDTLEALKDLSRFMKLTDGNVIEAIKRAKAYNFGLKNVDAEAAGMKDQSRASKKAALSEQGINAEWSKEKAVDYVNKQYSDKKSKAYESSMRIAKSLPTAAERAADKSSEKAKTGNRPTIRKEIRENRDIDELVKNPVISGGPGLVLDTSTGKKRIKIKSK